MGQVWHCHDRVLDVPVAIKIVNPRLSARSNFKQRFAREVALQARVRHPHLVPLHDAGDHHGLPFVAMAYAELGSLARYLPAGLPWARALRLMDEISAALAALHARGIIHLDIKPENILLHSGLDGQVHAWLTDLGIARLLDVSAEEVRTLAGTPAYMAPEQVAGTEAEIGPRTDIYSLGVVLAQVIGGNPVPSGLLALVRGMTNPDPVLRPAIVAEVRLALARLGEPSEPLDAPDLRRQATAPSTWYTDIRETTPPAQSQTSNPAQRWPWPRQPSPPLPDEPPIEPAIQQEARATLNLYAHRDIPLVGRHDELEQIWRQARWVREKGRTAVTLITGEAGAGKTRLVEEILVALEEGGWAEHLTFTYNSPPSPMDGYPGQIRRLLRPWGENKRQTSRRLTRWIDSGLPGVPAGPIGTLLADYCHNPGPQRDHAVLAHQFLHWVIHARCWRGLTCLFIENAHLAAEPGEGLDIPMHFLKLAALGQPAPVLLLCTIRSEALVEDPDIRRRMDLLLQAGALHVHLPRLGPAETRALLDSSLDLAPDIRDTVADRCDGNPLLARQIILEWAEQDLLEEVGNLVYTLKPGVDPSQVIPGDARQLFLGRVRRVLREAQEPERVFKVLLLLALAGAELPVGLADNLAGDLSEYVHASQLLELDQGFCRFSHDLLRQSLLEQARASDDLPELYRRLADAWQEYSMESGRDYAIPRALALLETGEAAQAFPILAQAAIEEQEQGNIRMAMEHGESAIRAMAEAGLEEDQRLCCRLLYSTALSYVEKPDLDRAEALARRAITHASSLEDITMARITLATVLQSRGHWQHARRLFQSAVELGRGQDKKDLLVRALSQLGSAAHRYGEPEEAIHAFQEALEAARAVSSPTLLSQTLMGLAMALSVTGKLHRTRDLCQEALKLSRRGHSPMAEAFVHHALGLVELDLGNFGDSRLHLRTAREMLRAGGAATTSHAILKALAEIHRIDGRYIEARKLLTLVIRWGDEHSLLYENVDATLMLLVLELQDGDEEAAIAAASKALDSLKKVSIPHLELVAWVGLALARARCSREGLCRKSISRAKGLRHVPRADRDLAWMFQQLTLETAVKGWRDISRWAASRAMDYWKLLSRDQPVPALANVMGRTGEEPV